MLEIIKEKVASNQRLSRDDVRWAYENASLPEISSLASITKKRFHPEDSATYLIMGIINYTNICVAKCDYCAFYRLPHQEGTYLLTFNQICDRIDQFLEIGGQLVSFNGGFHPKLKIQDYATLFQQIREKYGNSMEFYGMTVAEFMFSCKLSKLSYEEGAKILREQGSKWVTGGGAEILDDAFRMRHSPGKFKVDDYYDAQRAILDAKIGSTATMVIGFDETLEERLNHLEKLRDFQDSTPRKLPSFLLWTYKPYNTELGGKEIHATEYLRWLGICRIFLDNFKTIRTSVLTQNEKGLEGLHYGANDFDLPTEDEVTEKAGATINKNFEEILEQAQKIGVTPIKRAPLRVQ